MGRRVAVEQFQTQSAISGVTRDNQMSGNYEPVGHMKQRPASGPPDSCIAEAWMGSSDGQMFKPIETGQQADLRNVHNVEYNPSILSCDNGPASGYDSRVYSDTFPLPFPLSTPHIPHSEDADDEQSDTNSSSVNDQSHINRTKHEHGQFTFQNSKVKNLFGVEVEAAIRVNFLILVPNHNGHIKLAVRVSLATHLNFHIRA